MLKKTGYGASVKGIDLTALLYADDVVIVADSVDELQGLIDTVDRFCRRWRMEINLKKSEVMVVRARPWRCLRKKRQQTSAEVGEGTRETCHDDFYTPESACVLCSPWVCRGQRLKVVRKYKYLGIWFTSDLR